MVKHSARQKLSEGHKQFGIWCEIPSVLATEVVARSRFDWGCVDWQHGVADLETTTAMLSALESYGVTPYVRVRSTDPTQIGLALDVGSQGVIVPMVESVEQARVVVQACRYPPEGNRSIGPMRTSPEVGLEPATVNDAIAAVVMVETVRGLDSLPEIATIPGLDAVFIGPGDLQLSRGNPPTAPLETELLTHIVEQCLEAGVLPGIYAGGPDHAQRMADIGFGFIAVASDRELLTSGASMSLKTLARESAPTPGITGGLRPVLASDYTTDDDDE